jgi:hypothetical protein
MSRIRSGLGTLLIGVLVAGCSLVGGGESSSDSPASRLASNDRTFDTNDPVERGCTLSQEQLLRIWRGHDPAHSEDVTLVPKAPNYSGAFSVTSHSGPWTYVQRVPLVLYGPGFIKPSREPLPGHASIVDVYPTIGELLGVDLPERDGRARSGILEASPAATPRLVLTVMWDGVGRNVLERWPNSWPTLKRLSEQGSSFENAVVGSSPSITPATHSSLGTGAYPRKHGVTAIEYRDDAGVVRSSFAGRNPQDLQLTTYGDEIDLALGNAPLVGMLAWKSWHLGMLGHGSAVSGGDADQLALISGHDSVTGNDDYYTTPSYLDHYKGLDARLVQADRSDGEADGNWLGTDVSEMHDNPGWVMWQTDVLLAMLEREGYGDDDIPDLMFTNFKMTDIVGHQQTMDSEQMGKVLRAQDAALGRIIDYLDENVGDYVVVLSADHGHTPSSERSGAWPLLQGQLAEDIDERFGATNPDKSIVDTTTAVGPFLDQRVMRSRGIAAADVARFLNGYTIRDNWAEKELPEGFEERGDEAVLQAAWASGQFDEVLECAFGGRPPQIRR